MPNLPQLALILPIPHGQTPIALTRGISRTDSHNILVSHENQSKFARRCCLFLSLGSSRLCLDQFRSACDSCMNSLSKPLYQTVKKSSSNDCDWVTDVRRIVNSYKTKALTIPRGNDVEFPVYFQARDQSGQMFTY